MNEIELKILNEIKAHPGKTGRAIGKAIHLSHSETNRILSESVELAELCKKDSDGNWYTNEDFPSNTQESEPTSEHGVITHQIIYSWIKQAKNTNELPPYKYFTQFAFLWFAFNAYYSESYIDHHDFTEWEAINDCISHISENIVDNVLACNGFYVIQNELEHIKSMDHKHHGAEAFGYSYILDRNPDKRFKGLIQILYVVRCNLFHGHKSICSIRDQQIVKASVDCLMHLMTHLA